MRWLLSAANRTTVLGQCPLDIRTGVYNRDNVFVFVLVEPTMEDVAEAEGAIMGEWMVQRHRFGNWFSTLWHYPLY